MIVFVRYFDAGKIQSTELEVSRILPVSDLRWMIETKTGIKPENQMLMFAGKLMINEHTLYEYKVNAKDTIQLYTKVPGKEQASTPQTTVTENKQKPAPPTTVPENEEKPEPPTTVPENEQITEPQQASAIENSPEACDGPTNDQANGTFGSAKLKMEVESCPYFDVGDYVDCCLEESYWTEGVVDRIYKLYKKFPKQHCIKSSEFSPLFDIKNDHSNSFMEIEGTDFDNSYVYDVRLISDIGHGDVHKGVLPIHIRFRSKEIVPPNKLCLGEKYLVNYNLENVKERGFWFDFIVRSVSVRSGNKMRVCGDIKVGGRLIPNSTLPFPDEVYSIQECRGDYRPKDYNNFDGVPLRKCKCMCNTCQDDPSKQTCQDCGCAACSGKQNEHEILLCDECNKGYHIYCLSPPLKSIPQDEWYCPKCKIDDTEVVKAGDKLKESKKRAKMPSATTKCKRDWGRGNACVGPRSQCTLVPRDHFGPIPGVEVGQMWETRNDASAAGVHRPPVAGIHGRERIGAFSICLSGGYEDDTDDGDLIVYTGSGGRDLTNNRRSNVQSKDQKLTLINMALARNCNAPVNEVDGASAGDKWQLGKPIRLMRNYKGKNVFSPAWGNRYDGIYKVVSYKPTIGKAGFKVWTFNLRRDDPAPAPWTKEGKKRIEDMGLNMEDSAITSNSVKKGTKRTWQSDPSEGSSGGASEGPGSMPSYDPGEGPSGLQPPVKKSRYTVEDNFLKMIKADTQNVKLWNECLEVVSKGKPAFICKIQEAFACPCCLEILFKPVTLPCLHNICHACMNKLHRNKVDNCPSCRYDLLKPFNTYLNGALHSALLAIFSGYELYRK